jgi:hypothetical protein
MGKTCNITQGTSKSRKIVKKTGFYRVRARLSRRVPGPFEVGRAHRQEPQAPSDSMRLRPILFTAMLTLIFPTFHSFSTSPFAVGRHLSRQHGNLGPAHAPGQHRLRGLALSPPSQAVVLVEDAGSPHLKMHDLERAYEAMVTAFTCLLALFFLNLWASLCVLVLRGGVVQRTPTILAAVAALTHKKVLDFVAGPRSRHLLGLTHTAREPR